MQQQPYKFPLLNRYVRSAVLIALEEAKAFRHLRIHPEHILLGLIQAEGSIAETVLSAIDVTAQITRKVMTENIDTFEKVSDESLARNELAAWQVNLDEVLRVIGEITPKVGKVAPMSYTPEMSSNSMKLMSLATETIWRQKDRYFCTEHVLLALFFLQDSGTKVFLESVGLLQDRVQQTLESLREDTQEFKDMNNAGSH